MKLFRAHGRATRGVGAVGFVFLFASLMAGCALYDAFQNPAEGGNNGNNGESCSLERDFGVNTVCFSQCGQASDIAGFREDGIGCAEQSAGCALIPDGSGENAGVCLERGGDNAFEACAYRTFDDYLPDSSVGQFEPCEPSAAEYQIAARPDGGYVLAGCQKFLGATEERSPYGIRVVWLGPEGEVDGIVRDSTSFLNATDLDLSEDGVPRVRALSTTDADVALMVYDRDSPDSPNPAHVAITFAKGGAVGPASQHMDMDPCSVSGKHRVDLAGKGDYWLVTSCTSANEKTVLQTMVLALNGDDQIVASVPRVHLQNELELESRILQGVELNGPNPGNEIGDEPFRLLLADTDVGRLVSIPLQLGEAQSGDTIVGISEERSDVPIGSGLAEPVPTGFVPIPSADHAVTTDTRQGITSVAQEGNTPAVYSKNPAVDSPRALGEEAGRIEQPMGLEVMAVDAADVKAQPRPSFGGTLNWVVLSIVGREGEQAPRHGRLYGMSQQLDVMWTREIGRAGDFIPQHLAVSGTHSIAVAGTDESSQSRFIFMDAAGRAFCDQDRLSMYFEQTSPME